MIEQMLEHFQQEYPREACGILGIVKGKKKWFPCENVAEDSEDFVLSSQDYFRVKRQADILAIVHTHPDASPEPSQSDINNCNALGIPYYIYSYPTLEYYELQPETQAYPLIGREYEFGTTDCFEAMRDWLASKNINIAPRAPFEDDWWEKGLNYFTEETIGEWGFRKVEEAQENDLLIFQVEADVPNHCGVYLSNEVFFHHAVNRLSCRESLYPFWVRHLVGIYRYDA